MGMLTCFRWALLIPLIHTSVVRIFEVFPNLVIERLLQFIQCWVVAGGYPFICTGFVAVCLAVGISHPTKFHFIGASCINLQLCGFPRHWADGHFFSCI